MKIIYFGEIHSTDSDFPLVRTLQQKGHEVYYFIPLVDRFKKAGVIELNAIKNKAGLYLGTEFSELDVYKDYIDLTHLYFINFPKEGRAHLSTWIAFFKTWWLIKSIKADVMHLVWPLSWIWTYFYKISIPKLQVVHDPIRHSNIKSTRDEAWRVRAFKECDSLVILNKVQEDEFVKYYNIDRKKLVINKMGEFDYLRRMNFGERIVSGKYILFFGQIFSYKGLEYLCESMVEVHKKHPGVKLVIAGKGKMYFDYSRYCNLEYFELLNEYISLPRLANLLHYCEFTVCPYTDATQSGVILTSFSSNTPAVVSNVGALPVMVNNGMYGKVVPPKDVNSLTKEICNLLDKPAQLQLMRDNISNLWRPSMSWEEIADVYIKEYERISKENG